MFYDLTLKITPKMISDANGNEKISAIGHLGTHFDVMNKQFPLDYLRSKAIVFDVSEITDRDIEVSDIDVSLVEENMFVSFCTGCTKRYGYGNTDYFKKHTQLSVELIDLLISKKIRIIGVDAAGIRRSTEHTPMDQHCADNGVFVVENLDGLFELLDGEKVANCIINTYPVNFEKLSGLPCRVVGEK